MSHARLLLAADLPGPRIWSRVGEAGPASCWRWLGHYRGGYGRFSVTRRWHVEAHRAVYALVHGSAPAGMDIMHLCDNKFCVNPEHLRAGSRSENLLHDYDRGARRGFEAGPKHPNAKLSWAEVAAIRSQYRAGGYGSQFSQRGLAARYGVTQRVIGQIVSGRSYVEVRN